MSGTPRVVIVTGGSRRGGIGRAIAEAFVRLGDTVVISDLGHRLETHPDYEVAPADHLNSSVEELSVHGCVSGYACDVTREDDVVALFDHAENQHGQIDVVINCAGLAVGLKPLTELSLRDWQTNLEVMATGAFLVGREAARRMVPRGSGRIITIASQAGKTGMPLLAAYSAAKFAVIGLTQSMAGELGQYGVTVNAICPGTIDTPLLAVKGGVYETFSAAAGRTEEEYRRRLTRQIPANRFGTPSDISTLR